MISYELIYSAAVLSVLLLCGTFNITEIIEMQQSVWYVLPLLPIFLLFFVAALAETNRTPFDLPEAESELVAGFMTEHSGMIFVFFFLAEYCSIVLMSRKSHSLGASKNYTRTTLQSQGAKRKRTDYSVTYTQPSGNEYAQ